MSRFWRELPDGVAVAVKVQPKSRRPGVQGSAPSAGGERLRIGVSEPAENGRANRAACTVLAAMADGRRVRTVEALAADGRLDPIQQGFAECHGLQCGFCTPGMMMTARALSGNG